MWSRFAWSPGSLCDQQPDERQGPHCKSEVHCDGPLFKRLTSLAALGHLPKRDDESAQAWLYGKLLVALLVERLTGYEMAVSPWGYPLAAPSDPQRVA